MAEVSGGRGPVAVVFVVVAISFGAVVWATSLPSATTTATTRYLPVDGAAFVQAVTNDAGDGVYVTEHTRLRGALGILSMPQMLALYVFDALERTGVASDSASIWRQTGRRFQGDAVSSATTSVFADTDDGLVQLASYGGSSTLLFDPPLPVLTGPLVAGHRWSAAGDALPDGVLTYESSAEISAVGDDDCVIVDASLELEFVDASPYYSTTSRERWCPDVGVERAEIEYDFGGITEDVTFRIDPELVVPVLPPDAETSETIEPSTVMATWGTARDVGAWSVSTEPTVVGDAFFGDQAVTGSRSRAPLANDEGLLVLSYGSGDDVAGYLAIGGVLRERWRIHPGGRVLSLALVDDSIVVTTTERKTHGYDSAGVRRWTVATEDLVLAPAASVDGTAVTVGLDRRVTAIDVSTGTIAWRSELETDADLPAVVVGDVVVAVDRGGTVVAFDSDDGARRWSSTAESLDALVAVDDLVVGIGATGAVTAWSADDGARRWSGTSSGSARSAVALPGGVVVSTSTETVFFDATTGRRGPTHGVVEQLVVDPGAADGDHTGDPMIVAFTEQGVVASRIDHDGVWATVESWEVSTRLEATGVDIGRLAVAAGAGLWIVSDTAEVIRLGPEMVS